MALQNELIIGDCVQVMQSFSSESFDAILTDPTYGVTGDSDDYIATQFLPEAFRVLKPNTALMMFVGQATLREFWNAAEAAGFRWLNTIVWYYKNTIKRERKKFAIQYDPILYLAKGEHTHRIDAIRVPYLSTERLKYPCNNAKKQGWMPNPLGAICGDVWEVPAITTSASNGQDKKVDHKWQKPIVLFERMIKATTDPNQSVLDPFMGSGSSCLAAGRCGVNFTGIDIDERCIALTKERLEEKEAPRKRSPEFVYFD
jgi:site-specific DNA-methyltransferase (adenine-specific)